MEARNVQVVEKVSASKKLGRDKARELASSAKTVLVAKGRSVRKYDGGADDALIDAMVGATGNLRAPLLCVGNTVLVGFNEEAFEKTLR